VTDLDFETSQLQLVTDALRAGPGSPEWRAAMEAVDLPASGVAADEYKLLYAARERLASGRQYREVRAGPGFTRKVFDAIEQEDTRDGAAPAATPAANLIAGVSALVILGVLAAVVWLILPRGQTTPTPGNDLSQTYFVTRIEDTSFTSGLGAEWATFGKLPVEAKAGLRPIPAQASSHFAGGGAAYRRTFETSQPVAVEATMRLPKVSDDAVVQLFVTDSPPAKFDGDSATTPHELVWLLRGGDASVAMPNGAIESAPAPRVRDGQRIDVRLTMNRADGAVEMNGRRLWSGRHELDPTRPRTVGVRFIVQGKPEPKELPVVESVRVLVPQKP
jgi:hypothetical protein